MTCARRGQETGRMPGRGSCGRVPARAGMHRPRPDRLRGTIRRSAWWAVAVALCLDSCAPSAKAWNEDMRAASLAYQQGRYADAERLLKAAMKEAERFGPEDPRLITTLDNLATVYHAQGRYEAAEPLSREARSIDGKAPRPEVSTGGILAELSIAQGKYAEAEPLLARTLKIREKATVRDDAGIAVTLNDLGLVHYFQGKYAEAEPLLKRALEMREKALGPAHGDVAASLENYAALLRATNRPQEAVALDARAQAIRGSRALSPQ